MRAEFSLPHIALGTHLGHTSGGAGEVERDLVQLVFEQVSVQVEWGQKVPVMTRTRPWLVARPSRRRRAL